MHQHGLVDYGLRRRLPVQDRLKSEEEQKKLTLMDLIGAFILYGNLLWNVAGYFHYRNYLELHMRWSF